MSSALSSCSLSASWSDSPPGAQTDRIAATSRRIRTLTERVRCWLGVHLDLFLIQNDRVCLRCARCHRETPGWLLLHRPPWRGLADPRQRVSAAIAWWDAIRSRLTPGTRG